jgi:16S rRNA (guanine966-N2)-methyltransferase
MRVIAGRLRSRRLHVPRGDETRPTNSRAREALFSVLGDVNGKRVVDLYAGTGALGIEALSRGAKHVYFVERGRIALECLRRNLRELDLTDTSTVIAGSVESSHLQISRLGPHDLVFCDPPWSDIANVVALLNRWSRQRWLATGAMLVLEHPVNCQPAHSGVLGLVVADERRWGDTAMTFYVAAPGGDGDDGRIRS